MSDLFNQPNLELASQPFPLNGGGPHATIHLAANLRFVLKNNFNVLDVVVLGWYKFKHQQPVAVLTYIAFCAKWNYKQCCFHEKLRLRYDKLR
jgi:hypothetical protein